MSQDRFQSPEPHPFGIQAGGNLFPQPNQHGSGAVPQGQPATFGGFVRQQSPQFGATGGSTRGAGSSGRQGEAERGRTSEPPKTRSRMGDS